MGLGTQGITVIVETFDKPVRMYDTYSKRLEGDLKNGGGVGGGVEVADHRLRYSVRLS